MQYKGQFLKEISFPLGGIGTGSIGLGGDGRLIDWEIFNRPAKGSSNGYSHFAIRAIQGDRITPAVISGDLHKDYIGQYTKSNFVGYGHGPNDMKLYGFPHFRDVEFCGEFPIASLDFMDEDFPGDVRLTAFNPFIPNDSKNSSLPAAFFEIGVKNTTDEAVKYQIAFAVTNPYQDSCNRASRKNGLHMIHLSSESTEQDAVEYGELTLATDCETAYTQSYWYRGSWPEDAPVSYWNEFSSELVIKERVYEAPGTRRDTCTLIAEVSAAPGEEKKARFLLTWHVPNNYNYWSEYKTEEGKHVTWKNYYATLFENSAATAVYAFSNWDTLYEKTLTFKNALHDTTLPPEVIDAAASNLSVLKSPTVLRLTDGSFYGWEGVHETAGCCEGTCQHVWNYAYAMCFLFPDLERSIRETEFRHNTDESGKMEFRLRLPLGRRNDPIRACLDGQMGAVIKCYREWKMSGDEDWLRTNWENIKKVLEYAWSEENEDGWDLDKDGVLEGRQHHTLDMELFGPSSWLEGMYLLALAAAAEMAVFLGEEDKAREYRKLFHNGRRWMKENLFNGKYFVQKVDIRDKSLTDRYNASEQYWNEEEQQIKYQIGEGSSVDQMLAQWHAHLLGLGEIYDSHQLSVALSHMMQNNFKISMRKVFNPWRIFAANDEAGTIICDYPEDVEKPKIPIPYTQECMTGFEYAFAGLLCASGMTEEGFRVVRAVRSRYDGEKRNPWNEFECGSNYARSMASYALIPILSGFEFDIPHGHIGFNPYRTESFQSVWSVAGAWGNFEIDENTVWITVYDGAITLRSVGLPFLTQISSFITDGAETAFRFEKGVLCFEEITVQSSMEIQL